MKFTDNQIEAINHGKGPALVIAGPGSGKTKVLTHRIKSLIEIKKVRPNNILVITFSKAASTQMQSRFNNLCNNIVYPVEFRTFHSFFFNIISRHYNINTSNILNLKQKRLLLKKAIIKSNLISNPLNELIDILLKDISSYKNHNEVLMFPLESNISNEIFIKIYNYYKALQRSLNLIDFEDMMLIVRDSFINNNELLKGYQNKYEYILIDEYQDINDIQYEIIKKIVSNHNNIWACGDDDQSIYGFRASNPQIMLNFKKDFPNAKAYHLDTNFRSSDEIIAASQILIQNNKNRYKKNIIGKGLKNNGFKLLSFKSNFDENSYIVELLKKINDNSSTAILFRTNLEASVFAAILHSNSINFSMKENIVNPFKNSGVQIIMHYLSLAKDYPYLNSNDLIPVINKPMRYIKKELIKDKRININDLFKIYAHNNMMLIAIRSLCYQLNKLSSLADIYSQINYIRKGISIDDYLRITLGNLDAYDAYCKNINEILSISRGIKSLDELYEKEASFENINVNNKYKASNGLELMTFHASKGLEFDQVIIPHVNEGHVPHKKSIVDNIEEERRLLYVAMTRAKNYLYITYVSGSNEKEALPSRFIYPLINNRYKKGAN